MTDEQQNIVAQELGLKLVRLVDEQTRDNLLNVILELNDNGHQAFAVGGCVRDLILGKVPKDFDICTSAPVEETKAIFERSNFDVSIIDTGIEHGTITVHFKNNKDDFEITRFRKDVSTDGRRATVAFTNDLFEDLARRDLTINAIAWNPLTGALLTGRGFNGVRDLAEGKLRFVGDASERVQEDHLRALRYLRFAVQLNEFRFTFNQGLWKSEVLSVFDPSVLSFERIISELDKILKAADRLSGGEQVVVSHRIAQLRLFNRFGLNSTISQTTAHNMLKSQSFWPLIDEVLDMFDDNTTKATQELKLPADDVKLVGKIRRTAFFNVVSMESMTFHKQILTVVDDVDLAIDRVREIAILFGVHDTEVLSVWRSNFQQIKDENIPFAIRHLAIDGKDLMELGLQGKEVGDFLKWALNFVIKTDKSNTKETLLEIAKNTKS